MPRLFTFVRKVPQPEQGAEEYVVDSESTGVFGIIRRGFCEKKDEYVFDPGKHSVLMNAAALREIAEFMEKLPPLPKLTPKEDQPHVKR